MAVKPYTVTSIYSGGQETARLVVWEAMANGDTGQPYPEPGWADRNVQVEGNFGAGSTLAMEGSNYGMPAGAVPPTAPVLPTDAQFAPLYGTDGLALSFTTNGIKEFSAVPIWSRPNVTAGDAGTSLVVSMLVRKTK